MNPIVKILERTDGYASSQPVKLAIKEIERLERELTEMRSLVYNAIPEPDNGTAGYASGWNACRREVVKRLGKYV